MEAFQRDHHLQVDGVAGARTMDALQHAQPATTIRLDHPDHAGYGMYIQTLQAVHDLDARQGRSPDQMSANLAGALVAQSRAEGMTRVDHLALSDDATRAYAIQGDPNSPFKQYASVDIARAVVQPFEQSSFAWTQAHQQQQQPSPPPIEMNQPSSAVPTMAR